MTDDRRSDAPRGLEVLLEYGWHQVRCAVRVPVRASSRTDGEYRLELLEAFRATGLEQLRFAPHAVGWPELFVRSELRAPDVADARHTLLTWRLGSPDRIEEDMDDPQGRSYEAILAELLQVRASGAFDLPLRAAAPARQRRAVYAALQANDARALQDALGRLLDAGDSDVVVSSLRQANPAMRAAMPPDFLAHLCQHEHGAVRAIALECVGTGTDRIPSPPERR